jgi:hypothetical protein
VPRITKDWVIGLDFGGIEKILALGMYNRRATLLSIETDSYFHACFDDEEDQEEVFWGYFIPYYTLWVSMLYVVDEGLVALDVEDAKLQKIRDCVDMGLLRRFRNATFHFQPAFRSPKHDDLFARNGFAFQWELWQRQDFLVRKLTRFVKLNPNSGKTVGLG